MECRPYEIGCKLDNIAHAIGEPTNADWWSIGISAAAVVATSVIAVLNFVLLRRQHNLQIRETLRAARLSRAEYATELKRDILRRWMNGAGLMHTSTEERSRQLDSLARAGALTDEPTQVGLDRWVTETFDVFKDFPNDVHVFHQVEEHMSRVIDDWVRDPSSSRPVSIEVKREVPTEEGAESGPAQSD